MFTFTRSHVTATLCLSGCLILAWATLRVLDLTRQGA